MAKNKHGAQNAKVKTATPSKEKDPAVKEDVKKTETVAKVDTTSKEDTTKQTPPMTPEAKAQEETQKQAKKDTTPSANKKDGKKKEDPSIESATAEELPANVDVIDLQGAFNELVKNDSGMSPDATAKLYGTLHDRFNLRKDEVGIAVNAALDVSGVMLAAQLTMSAAVNGKKIGLRVPSTEVENVVNALSFVGLKDIHVLPEAKKPKNDPTQTEIVFATAKDIDAEVKEAVKNKDKDNKTVQKEPVKLTADQWGSDEDAKAGLSRILINEKGTGVSKLVEAIKQYDTYFLSAGTIQIEKSKASDDEKKKEIAELKKSFEEKLVSEKIKELLSFVTPGRSGAMSGFASSVSTYTNLGKNPLRAHALVRRNMVSQDDNLTKEIVKGLILAKQVAEGVEKPEESKAYLALSECNALDILGYSTRLLTSDKTVTGTFLSGYFNGKMPEVFDKNDPKKIDREASELLLVNKMIEISNLYRPETDQIDLVKPENYLSALAPIVKEREAELVRLGGSKAANK